MWWQQWERSLDPCSGDYVGSAAQWDAGSRIQRKPRVLAIGFGRNGSVYVELGCRGGLFAATGSELIDQHRCDFRHAHRSRTYSVVMSVTDSGSPAIRVSVVYTIIVSGSATLSITSGAPPAGTVSVAYGGSSGFPLVASGGMAPYTWSWTAAAGSALPPGLVLSGSSITGTPTLNGSYNVTVTVTDSETQVAQTSASYTIIIGSAGPLTITSGALPNGVALAVYGDAHHLRDNQGRRVTIVFFQLTASGGSGNYTWSWAAAQGSSLPPGLGCCAHFFETGYPREGVSVNGAVFGIPTTPGTYNIVLTLTDAHNTSASASA